jgi:subtilisin-like proprotein convertase family protein
MMKHLSITFMASLLALSLSAQSVPAYFQKITEQQIFLPQNAETVTMPNSYLTFQLDLPAMRNHLRNAPAEGSAEALSGNFTVELPLPDGSTETFKAWDSPVMDPALAERYPMIRTFAGIGANDPTHTVRFGFGLDGFHAFIITKDGGTIVTPYASNQTQYYLCFNRSELSWNSVDLPSPLIRYEAMEGGPLDPSGIIPAEKEVSFRGGGEGALTVRRNYRFALACTGEYGASHGGTVASALSTLVTATNTLNSVVERDADFRLVMIANNDLLVFTNPASDPYNNANMGGALLGQNEDVINNIIGLSSYDIGHVYTASCTDVGGVVSGSVCSGGKGRGVTCNFSSDVVGTTLSIAAHEMGHQFTGGHTFNNCPGQEGQHHSGSAWEPGSGSTILSYQGSCGSNNIPGPANVHYHGGTVEEFWICTHDTGGSICGNTVETTNHSPVVNHNYVDGFYIPISTPFELNASASDADGDPLKYVWEEIDLGPSAQLGTPVSTSPLFRVYDPVSSGKRYFPKLSTILSNGSEAVEVLPTYTRELNFRCTVRDYNVTEGAGGITWKDVKFFSTASAGPFRVTYPNSNGITLKGGQEVEMTWDVANTDGSLVNCKTVNIKLSTDGGQTFPYTLVSATPNDGTEKVFLPDLTTTSARVRIEAAENIFFDLSNQNFAITPAETPSFTLALSPQAQQVCVPNNATVEIETGSVLNFDTLVQFEVIGGLPAGVDVSFSNSSVMPGQSTSVSFDMANVTADGNYEVELRAIAGTDTILRTLYFNIVYNDFSALDVIFPADGQSSLDLLPTFTWTDLPQADFYTFELATSPSFEPSTILQHKEGLTTASYTPTIGLEESKIYYWRISPSNECGTADFISPKSFQTYTVVCSSFNSSDVPKNISGVGTPTVNSVLTILQNGIITDLNVAQIKGNHDKLNDLQVNLISPSGTTVKLFENICGNVSQFNLGLNDEAAFDIACPPLNGLAYKPQQPLAAFKNEDQIGDWTLQVKVIDSDGQGGTLEKWSLQFCASTTPNGPILVNDDTIYVKPLGIRPIFNTDLAVEDPDNIASELQFTIVDDSKYGYLTKNGVQLGVGDHFTMAEIHAQKMAYTNTNPNEVYDYFTFVVEDGTGGWLGTPKLNIVIDENAVTGVSEEALENTIFLSPNPATNLLNVNFQRPLKGASKALFHDLQGRLVASQDILAGEFHLQTNLDNFTSGIYFITVSTPEGVMAKKFVVQK